MITYVFDPSLSPALVLSLRVLIPEKGEKPVVVEHDVCHASDVVCAPGEFLATIARKDDILVTCLTPARRRVVMAEIVALGLRSVHLVDAFSGLNIFEQAGRLISAWTRVVKDSYRLKKAHGISVRLDGHTTLMPPR